MLVCAQKALDNWRQLFGLLLAELLAGDVGVVPEASGAICLTSFLMYSLASSTSSGVNCGQTLCGDILTQCKQQDFWRVRLLSTISYYIRQEVEISG